MTFKLLILTCTATFIPVFAHDHASAQGADEAGYADFVELRVYRARPDRRDAFVKYFEEHFLESQEVVGSRIWGQFSDLGDPAQFVWVRGFRTMEQRKDCLEQFYSSETWHEYRPGVLKMLVSASNTRLLEPVEASDSFEPSLTRQPIAGAPYGDEDWETNAGVVVIEVFLRTQENTDKLIGAVRERVNNAMLNSGGRSLGLYTSSDQTNTYPRLPLIEHEQVVVWIGTFESENSYEAAVEDIDVGENSITPRDAYVLSPGERSRMYHRPDTDESSD